jgi:hypothetical protein
MDAFRLAALTEADAVLRHVILLRVCNAGLGAEGLTQKTRGDLENVKPITLDVMHGSISKLRACIQYPETLQAFMAIVNPGAITVAEGNEVIAIYERFVRWMRKELGQQPLTLLDDPHKYFPIYLGFNAHQEQKKIN